MRKAIALIMLMVVFCCSVFAQPSGNIDIAIGAVSNGLVSAFASWFSEPHITLQGVVVVSGEGILPSRISFVRSDVATYRDSLSFFDNEHVFSGDSSAIMTELSQSFTLSRVRDYLQKFPLFGSGDAVLDGSVRLLNEKFPDTITSNDWSGIEATYSLSIMVTGAVTNGGFIVECLLRIEGGPSRGVTIEAEDFTVNGVDVDIQPVQA